MNSTEIAIIQLLQEHKEIKGLSKLAKMINTNDKGYVRTCTLTLQRIGIIEIVYDTNHPRGGMSHGTTFRLGNNWQVQQ